MSRFLSRRHSALAVYTPGEQPQDMSYVKLNTNESPFPPTEAVRRAAEREAGRLQLYSDPECVRLREKMAEVYGLSPEQVLMGNGSDELLNFAFMAFADERSPLVFPDITYGFYPVFAGLNHIPYTELPLRADFSISAEDYLGVNKTIVLANPNAPTGMCLDLSEIERILSGNPDNAVIIDEAYVDFGAESAVGLLGEYDNLIVIGTFSKSRSLAGARLGFCFAAPELIRELNALKYCTNPYNVNRMTAAAGLAALEENGVYMDNCRVIAENRRWTAERLAELGFSVLPSGANFVFAESQDIDGERLYLELKRRGVLIRHFTRERIKNYNRITVGTMEQMRIFIEKTKEILGAEQNAKS